MSDEAEIKVGDPDSTANRLVVLQEMITRSRLGRLAGVQYGGLRDIYTVAGYPHKVLFDHYWGLYKRGDVAGRIVDMPPSTTWKTPPDVQEEGMDAVKGTEFTQAFGKLAKRLKLWSYMERLDRLCGVGQYAVMFIGVRGVSDDALKMPLTRVSKPEDLIYLSVYSERHAPIYNWVTDAGDERFGLPKQYKLLSSTEQVNGTSKGIELYVDASRCLHAAEGVLEDDTFGRPRLERPLNRLFDLDKVAASTGESYWQQVTQILQAKIDQDHEITEAELKDLDDKLSEMTHDLRRTFYGRGIDLSYLNSSTPNVSQVGDFYFSLIAGASGIPKRILFGSELGELASTQDQANYMGMISERQEHFAEPVLLRAFIDKCIAIGALPTPKKDGGEYNIVWPPLFEDSAKDRAQVNLYHAQTAAALTPVGGNPRELVKVTDEGDVELIERDPDEPLPLEQMFPPPPDPNHPDPNAPPEAGGGQPGKTGDNKPNPGGDNGPNPKPPSAGGGDKQTSKNWAEEVWEHVKQMLTRTPAGQYNPNHDERGEFASGDGGGSTGEGTGEANPPIRTSSGMMSGSDAQAAEFAKGGKYPTTALYHGTSKADLIERNGIKRGTDEANDYPGISLAFDRRTSEDYAGEAATTASGVRIRPAGRILEFRTNVKNPIAYGNLETKAEAAGVDITDIGAVQRWGHDQGYDAVYGDAELRVFSPKNLFLVTHKTAHLYNPNHDERGEFASGSGGPHDVARSMRAKSSYKPSTARKQRIAEAEQARMAQQLQLKNTSDNEPFDLLGKGVGIEVKTLLDNNNDKITVHPESRKRKEAFAKQMRIKKTYTVVIDKRGGKRDYYIKEGVGAFRLKNMKKVSLPQMKGMF